MWIFSIILPLLWLEIFIQNYFFVDIPHFPLNLLNLDSLIYLAYTTVALFSFTIIQIDNQNLTFPNRYILFN